MASNSKGKGLPSGNSLADELAANGLHAYRLTPPSWREPWLNGIENSGYPQFYPTCDGQDEDQLTESAVKSGFSGKTIVQTETFSAHQLIYERLKGDTILPALSRLATAVAERAQSRVLPFGPYAFRLPQRLTLNDQKREAWLNDLANQTVPLSKLSRSVPHGFRGEKLIEMLYLRQIPLPRAIWYIRAIGAHEIQAGIKSRPGFTVAQYTREWTTVVQEFVRKQLAEIALPEAASSFINSVSSRGTGKGVLVDGELRASWTTRFGYSLRLLEGLYEEYLIERDSFLRFLVHQTENSNLAQLPFAIFLAEEYLGEFLFSEPLSARLAYACFTRLSEVVTEASSSSQLEETSSTLSSIIRSIFIALPDAFVASPLWQAYSKQLEVTILATTGLDPSLLETIRADLMDLTARAEASRECTQDADSLEPDELEIIQILDNIAFPVDLAVIHKALFRKRRRRPSQLNELNILFSWATTPDRSGPHRVYAVAALIAMELEHPSSTESPTNVENGFIQWIDTGPTFDRWGITLLLAELIRVGDMSYSLYLQRMIARGETEPSSAGRSSSLHLHLLRTVALDSETSSSLGKIRVALLAPARQESHRLLETVQYALSEIVPGLLSISITALVSVPSGTQDCTILLEALEGLAKDGSHLIVTRQWIPQGVSRLLSSTLADRPFSIEQHAVLAQVFLAVCDLWGLLQYLILVLRSQPSRELLFHVLDNIESDLGAWTSMAALPSLGRALLSAHEGLKGSGVNDRRLVSLLRQLGSGGHLDSQALVQLEQDAQSLVLSLSTSRVSGQIPSAGMTELQTLVQDGSPQAVAQLATTLWYRYHSSENWGQVVFDNSIWMLSQVPVPTILCLLREINERLPTGLEPCIGRWMTGMSQSRICSTFGGPLAPALALLFGDLVLRHTLSAIGAVTVIILPSWSALLASATTPVATLSSPVPSDDKSVQLRGLETIAAIFGTLVGCDPSRDPSNSPSELLLRQGAESRRTSLYVPSGMPDVGRCISMLAIQQELWTARADYEKAHVASTLILHVSSGSSFKMSVARDPQAFASAMLDSPCVTVIPAAPAMLPKLLAALLLILKDGRTATPASLVSTEEWDLFLSGLTTWRLAVSKVEVQACLERLDLDTALQDEEKAQALNTLSRHFLDRVCQGDGHMYLGEQVVRCYHGRASDELVSVAFSRLAVSIDGLAYSASPELRASSFTTLRCAGRLLDTLLQSSTASSRSEPLSALLISIKGCLEGLLEAERLPEREVVLHVTLLLGIALRCAPSTSTSTPNQIVGASNTPPECCELFKDCLVPLARLAVLLAKSTPDVSDLASVLLDACAHVFFAVTTFLPWSRLPSLQTFFSAEADFDLLSDPIVSRLTRLFGQETLSVPVVNPWELVDQGDPAPVKDARHNAGPIDLAFFDAKVLESVPALTAIDCPQSPATSSGHSERDRERGLQTNFDFETPTTGLSLPARDFRRTLVGSKNVPGKYDPAKLKVKEGVASEAGTVVPSTAGGAGRAGKRKEAPEVLVISDGDDDLPVVRAPPARRGRGAGASKPAGARGTAGAARKKPKG